MQAAELQRGGGMGEAELPKALHSFWGEGGVSHAEMEIKTLWKGEAGRAECLMVRWGDRTLCRGRLRGWRVGW